MEYLTMNDNNKIPIIGFGTYFLNPYDTYEAVLNALKEGYTLLDCAKWYQNEALVGEAIKESKKKREDLFITTKVECNRKEKVIIDIYDSLSKLQTTYLDLVLIHWPTEEYLETYKALEELQKKGIIKSIGISNFNQREVKELLKQCTIKPVVNQIETHIYFQEKKMHQFLKENNIVHEGWAPFAEGYLNIFQDKTIQEIANNHKKSPAQIMLRFQIQKDIIVIPKSTNKKHIKENINIFDFELTKEEMKKIESLDQRKQYSGWPMNMQEETK